MLSRSERPRHVVLKESHLPARELTTTRAPRSITTLAKRQPDGLGERAVVPSSGDSRLTAMVFAFLLGISAGEKYPPLLLVAYLAVIGMVAIAGGDIIRRRFEPSKERVLLGAFVAWALLSGAVLAQPLGNYATFAERLLQSFVVLNVVASLTSRQRTALPALQAIVLVAIASSAYGLLTGEFGSALQGALIRGRKVGVRAEGLFSNPNTLAVFNTWALGGIALWYRRVSTLRARTLLLVSVPLLLAGVVLSASRKGVVLPILLLASWLYLCHEKTRKQRMQAHAILIAGAAILSLSSQRLIEDTYAGKRLSSAMDQEDRDPSTATRLEQYEIGIDHLIESPLFGIGLGQWGVHSPLVYAHSEYVEIAGTTGVPGALLYFTCHFVAARRTLGIYRTTRSAWRKHEAGLHLALLLNLAVAGLAQVLFTGFPFWVLVGAVWGFNESGGERNTTSGKRDAAAPGADTRESRAEPARSLRAREMGSGGEVSSNAKSGEKWMRL